ncbi:hypothetical protein MRB53_004047 [Persea americana]|uniref:Uncharacterized protein n=1 Tax=Persea americana TaxID=3435 RepID=A0ACC2MZG8_PERAE|nr:hypothetical protein MRB53_004047 [Persea americana]
MGQASSTAGFLCVPARRHSSNRRMRIQSTAMILSPPSNDQKPYQEDEEEDHVGGGFLISDLPDECLACVFQFLGSGDRKRSSLVCRRWRLVEAQSRLRLSLDARAELLHSIHALFSRFDSVSKLALKCDRRSASIGDDGILLISLRCRNLTRLKLRSCRQITDAGVAAFAANAKSLKKLSCGSCAFGATGLNAVLDGCSALEELSVKRLKGLADGSASQPIGPGNAAASLRSICLKELYNGQCFGPLLVGSKNLKTLKLIHCAGDWDKLLKAVSDHVERLTEIHLEKLQVTDRGLSAISNCSNLEILHLVKTTYCTDVGLSSIAERCKFLRKLHIDGWKTNQIGDEGLSAVANRCPNLQELVLIALNPTILSLGLIASNCKNLERLALCASETIGDAEISCIAAKCSALKKLCIKGCPVSDHGMEALATGCPNLVKVKVRKCRGVTCEGMDWLRATRSMVTVNLDADTIEQQDASASDGGAAQEDQFGLGVEQTAGVDIPSSSSGQSAFYRARRRIFAGKNFMFCTLRRLSHSSNGNRGNS